MENQLTEKESLELIGKMINSAKNNLQKGTGKIFLLWGYLTMFVSIINLLFLFLLPKETNYYAYIAWFAMPLGSIFHYILIRKSSMEGTVKTYIEQMLTYVWLAFSMSVLTLVVSMMLASIPGFREQAGGMLNFLNWIHWMFLIPFMLILYGFALFVSGKAYRFKPMITGALICWGTTVIIFLMYENKHFMEVQLAGLIISVVAGYIVPGHLLNKKENGNV
jgi:hypothetical protein